MVLLLRYIEDWLSRANPGEDAEGSLSRFLMYGWGAFPFLMYLMVSGVSGLSGGALGSIVGGLIWLLLMYFIGLNYRIGVMLADRPDLRPRSCILGYLVWEAEPAKRRYLSGCHPAIGS